MRSLLPLLSSLSLTLALDFVSTDTGFFTYSPSAWNLYDLLPNASGCSGKTEFGPDGPASFTFTFPQFSTSFEWWGVKSTGGGKVTVCFDGATGATCDTVDYFDPNFVLGATPPIRLYRKTGLSNTAHTVVITNIADSAHGNLFGQISMDKVVIDGTVPAPPIFPSNTFLTSIPLINGAVLVDPLLGSGPAGIRVLMDSGASGAWVVWSGCTDPLCAGHATYTPSSKAFNFSYIDQEFYTEDGLEFDSWRMNDTLTYGNVSIPVTFGAAFKLPDEETWDGNFGIAKSVFVGGACGPNYAGFVESAYLSGAINAPVLAYYTGSPPGVSGLPGVVQIGGIDRNKYVGAMDWIPVDHDSKWRSLKQQRTVKTSSTAAPFNATGYFPIDNVVFDTGYGGSLWVPHGDFLMLAGLTGAFDSDGQGSWQFPCDSVMTFNFLGSQGVTYTIPLADKNSPSSVNGYCGALAVDGDDSPDWVVGTEWFSNFYLAFHYKSNLLGIGKKNTGISAETAAVVIGQA